MADPAAEMNAPAPNPENSQPPAKQAKDVYPLSKWKYDSFLWAMSFLADIFFREIHPRGSWKVPRHGPVMFVAAPHANQFVDPLLLQRTLRSEAKRRVTLLIARKSVQGFIGWASRQVGSVVVGRQQDLAKPAKGTIYLPDPANDPTLVYGIGTDFEREAEVGGGVFLPSVKGKSGTNADVAKILGPEKLRLKRRFQGPMALRQLTGRDDMDENGHSSVKEVMGPKPGYGGTMYKLAPHIDQSLVYQAVSERFRSGGCIGIFPEGGSHDRTELLPLKAGVAIMVLETLADAPDCGLKIVPVGMNYFHAHKFRSRAVIEFGPPLDVPRKYVDMYRDGQRRDSIGPVLDMVHQALSAVTVSTPDYDTLMTIQAARRLYNPTGKKLPLPIVVELNRRLALGYEKYKNDERIVQLKQAVKDYNRQLRYMNLRDHQVQYAKMSWPAVFLTFFLRLTKLLVLSAGVLPGLILFAPVFIATKVISRRQARAALAGSSVKIQGRDVIATWKLLVSLAFAPLLYNFYSCLLVYRVYQDRLWGHVPDWIPLWMVFLASWAVSLFITYASFRFGEVGMDIFKSLRPLALCLIPTSSYNIRQLRERRAVLSAQVTDVINTLGPEMFPDFEHTRLLPENAARISQSDLSTTAGGSAPVSPVQNGFGAGRARHGSDASSHGGLFADGGLESPTRGGGVGVGVGFGSAATRESSGGLARRSTQSSRAIPKNESFSNIGQAPMFATRPPSRSRSRSSSVGGLAGAAGFPISGFTTMDGSDPLDEANRLIREELRRRRRRSQASNGGASMASLGGGGSMGSNSTLGDDESDEDEDGETYLEVKKQKKDS